MALFVSCLVPREIERVLSRMMSLAIGVAHVAHDLALNSPMSTSWPISTYSRFFTKAQQGFRGQKAVKIYCEILLARARLRFVEKTETRYRTEQGYALGELFPTHVHFTSG